MHNIENLLRAAKHRLHTKLKEKTDKNKRGRFNFRILQRFKVLNPFLENLVIKELDDLWLKPGDARKVDSILVDLEKIY